MSADMIFFLVLQQLQDYEKKANYAQVLTHAKVYLATWKANDPNEPQNEVYNAFHLSLLNFATVAAIRTGQLDEAVAYGDEGVTVAQFNSTPTGLAKAYNNRGLAWHEKGQLNKAFEDYQAGIACLSGIKDEAATQLMTTLRGNLNLLQLLRGECTDTNEAQQPAEWPRDLHTFNNIGYELLMEGKHKEAESYFLQAMENAYALPKNIEIQGIIHCNLGMVYDRLNQDEKAEEHYIKAIACHSTQLVPQDRLAIDLFNLAALYEKQRKTAEAIEKYKAAWDAIREQFSKSLIALRILTRLGTLRLINGEYDRSRAAFQRGMQLYESIRPDIAVKEAEHAAYFQAYRDLAEMSMYQALNESWTDELLALIERAKARYWKERMGTKNNSGHEAGFIATVEDIKKLTGHSTLIIDFFVGPNASFVSYSYNGSLGGYRIDITEKALQELIEAFRLNLMSFSRRAGEDTAGKKLGALLFDKLVFPADNIRHMLILPDGVLWDLPLETLPLPASATRSAGKLYDQAPVSYVPSLSVLKDFFRFGNVQDQPVGMCLLTVSEHTAGFDSLTSPDRDAALLTDMLSSRSIPLRHLANENATQLQFFEAAANAQYIHISTHAVADAEEGEPFIILYGNGEKPERLRNQDIEAATFNADLVFLSACTTATGAISPGEGLMSISRAFLWAGCKAVIAAHWYVSDEKTSVFTHIFYEALFSGLTISQAMQAAKRKYISTGGETRIWASFQVYGVGDTHKDRYSLKYIKPS